MKKLMIDPPGGWRYGFPKVIPDSQLCRIRHWLVENGYPESEMESYGQHFNYRMWSDDSDDNGDSNVDAGAFASYTHCGGGLMRKEEHVVKVTCNRCGHEDEWTDDTPNYLKAEWSDLCIGGEAMDTPPVFDLCPACTREIKVWIRNGR